jgi:hypothetical protein
MSGFLVEGYPSSMVSHRIAGSGCIYIRHTANHQKMSTVCAPIATDFSYTWKMRWRCGSGFRFHPMPYATV